jgi:hypothetical protein
MKDEIIVWIIVRRKGSPVRTSCNGYLHEDGSWRFEKRSGIAFAVPPESARLFDSEDSAQAFLDANKVPGYDLSMLIGGGEGSSWDNSAIS